MITATVDTLWFIRVGILLTIARCMVLYAFDASVFSIATTGRMEVGLAVRTLGDFFWF